MEIDDVKKNIWGIEEIRAVLRIGRNKAYEYCNEKDCPATKDGKGWTVYADDFLEWYRNKKKNKE